MEKTSHDGAPSGLGQVPLHHHQTVSSATNTGEKRKREGETENSSEIEQVIIVGDTTAIKDIGFAGGEQSWRSLLNKGQAFDVQSNRNRQGSLEKEEPERAKQVLKFNDFDKLREERKFAVGQTWALYDTDGFPRLFAQIRKVSAPGFGLSITWLEPDPDDKEEIKNRQKELPVCFGNYRLGKTQSIKDQKRFSHVVHCYEGSSAGKFNIYPRKGETWAVFKGRYKCRPSWDIDWSPDPESHSKYQYGFVEILSEYVNGCAAPIGFLHKAKGFSSVFCRFTEEPERYYIHRNDTHQFSHCVPSFKMTGTEAEGVPRGGYELDPASLPENIKEIDVPMHLLAEPTVSKSENDTHSHCVYFASKGITFQTGQIWSFCSGDDHLPRYYGKIQKITFIQEFEQEPVVTLHVSRLKATPIKGVIQWTDKKMPNGCGNFRALKALERFTDLDVFSRQINPESSGDGTNYSIMPKTGEVWAIYRNWSGNIKVAGLQSQTYDLVEVLDDQLDYKVLLLASDGGFNLANHTGFASVYLASVEHWTDGADVRFTIRKSDMLRFSHQIPTSKVTQEIHGALQEVYEPNIEGLPVKLTI